MVLYQWELYGTEIMLTRFLWYYANHYILGMCSVVYSVILHKGHTMNYFQWINLILNITEGGGGPFNCWPTNWKSIFLGTPAGLSLYWPWCQTRNTAGHTYITAYLFRPVLNILFVTFMVPCTLMPNLLPARMWSLPLECRPVMTKNLQCV